MRPFIFLTFLVVLSIAIEPFSQLQVLTDFSSRVNSIDISHDNKILVAAHSAGTSIWIRNSQKFIHTQSISSRGKAYYSDITGDGQRLLIAYHWTINARLYENIDGTFILLQTFMHDAQAAAITDDHEWIALGSFYEVKIYK